MIFSLNLCAFIFSPLPSLSCYGSEEMCRSCWSQKKAAFDILSNMKGERERAEERNWRKWGGKFSYYISLFHLFFWIFFLWWWYGKLRGRLAVLLVRVFHIIFVSFSPKGNGGEDEEEKEDWQWHFRQLKHFLPSSLSWTFRPFCFFLLEHFSFFHSTFRWNYLFLFTGLLFKQASEGEQNKKNQLTTRCKC